MYEFKNLASLPYFPGTIYGIESCSEQSFILSSWATIYLVNISSGEIQQLGNHDEIIYSISLDSSNTIVASGSLDKTIRLWDVSQKSFLKLLALNKDPIRAVKFSEGGRLLASGGDIKYKDPDSEEKLVRVYLWDWEKEEVEHIFYGHQGYIRKLEFFSDDKYLASLDNRGVINIWNIQTRSLFKRFEVNCFDFAIDQKCKSIITSGDNGIQFWDLETLKCIKTFASEVNCVSPMAYSPVNNLIAASIGKEVHIFDYPTGKIRGQINVRSQYINFSLDGSFILMDDPSGDYAIEDHHICLSIWEIPKDLWLDPGTYPIFKQPTSIELASQAEPETKFSKIDLPKKPDPPEISEIPYSESKALLQIELENTKFVLSKQALFLSVLSFLGSLFIPGGIILTTILIILWAGTAYINGGLKRRKLRKALVQASQEESLLIEEWDKTRQASLQEYEGLMQEWILECQNIELEKNKNDNIDPLLPEEANKEQVRKAVCLLHPINFEADLKPNAVRRGYAEVKSNFPRLLKQYFGEDKIFELKKVLGKVPDFIYRDERTHLAIDIEIDEPYTPRRYPEEFPKQELKVTHCIEQVEDEERDLLFTEVDWFVIRFSEGQVIQYPASCCKYIAQKIDYLSGTKYLEKFAHVVDLDIDYRWTKSGARCMAKARDRLSYE